VYLQHLGVKNSALVNISRSYHFGHVCELFRR